MTLCFIFIACTRHQINLLVDHVSIKTEVIFSIHLKKILNPFFMSYSLIKSNHNPRHDKRLPTEPWGGLFANTSNCFLTMHNRKVYLWWPRRTIILLPLTLLYKCTLRYLKVSVWYFHCTYIYIYKYKDNIETRLNTWVLTPINDPGPSNSSPPWYM